MNNRKEGGKFGAGRASPKGPDKRQSGGWNRSNGGDRRNNAHAPSAATASRPAEDDDLDVTAAQHGGNEEELIAGKHPVLEAMKAGRALNTHLRDRRPEVYAGLAR